MFTVDVKQQCNAKFFPKADLIATVRKNIRKMIFFPGQGKIREFCGCMVREIRKKLEKTDFENY